MPRSGCSALHGVNLNFFKNLLSKFADSVVKAVDREEPVHMVPQLLPFKFVCTVRKSVCTVRNAWLIFTVLISSVTESITHQNSVRCYLRFRGS